MIDAKIALSREEIKDALKEGGLVSIPPNIKRASLAIPIHLVTCTGANLVPGCFVGLACDRADQSGKWTLSIIFAHPTKGKMRVNFAEKIGGAELMGVGFVIEGDQFADHTVGCFAAALDFLLQQTTESMDITFVEGFVWVKVKALNREFMVKDIELSRIEHCFI